MAREAQTKAERRRARSAAPAPERRLDARLARLELAVLDQSERTEESLEKLARATEAMDAAAAMERALGLRRENAVPVREPLVLICQAQRSGGTLLARLFDGHPQVHAHPHELHIGARRPHTWPDLPLDEEPEAWFSKLREERLADLFEKGKRRVPLKAIDRAEAERHYPFILPPSFQRSVFLDEVARRSPVGSEREILDCYMTSLFNAWLDNQNLGGDKRWVVAFSPRRAWGDGLKRFFSIYPDGRLVSILRDPWSWFSSALGRDPEADPASLLELWKRSVREMVDADRRFGEQLGVLRFDELVLDTETPMRGLANWLDIDFDERLTSPTFNGYPVGPNSSYETDKIGVVTDPVERYKQVLSDEQQELVRGECDALYQEALALAERRAAR